ncbi:DUF1885 family protein [Paenibacillus sp. UNC499MF]|uniref:DUF1885 family protein n=1 Tax=Paenibacillus sp. UNC499MF TaxID=1502751 RepID=UPI0008A0643A|nr:DUF1885 family protein [Paenibacillus sp. UNC499MF]SEF53256.1 protein of unknown function [Paenibacillus sp. UNC499MF]
MSQSAFIRFVTGSTMTSPTLDELKGQLEHYREQLSRTGAQLSWEYDSAGFPYTMETKPEGEGKWFYLKGTTPRYRSIVLGVGSETREDTLQHYVQIVLPDTATHGDKSKANELGKYLARQWKAQLDLFNGRTMYFNPRK